MLKLLAAGLIASTAMIGTVQIAAADPVTITFRFNDTEEEVRGAIDAFQKQRGGDTDEHQAPAVTRQDETGMPS